MISHKQLTYFFLAAQLAFCCALITSCRTIDLYEKVVPVPKNEWSNSFKPQFKFIIKDTAVPYQVYVLLRHNEKYSYNNIWLNLYTQGPGDSIRKVQYELPLANSEKGWLGTAMDDLYDHRIALTPANQKFYFKKAGEYTFTIEQIMREDPLRNVMNIGLRIEKKEP
jgi:gliding motility-associated lipoprotein GldH